MISKLDFDSELFELQVGKIELETGNLQLDHEDYSKYDLVYIFSPENIYGFEEALVDVKLTFKLEINKSINDYISDQSEQISEFDIEYHDFDSIEKLAFLSGTYSRFKRDENLPSNSFIDLYSLWIKKSINRECSDKVFVFAFPEAKEKVIGFVSLKIEKNIGIIGLIAVDSEHHGMGVGKSLLNELFLYLKKNNIKFLQVSTQIKNIGAINFYKKSLFEEFSRLYIYHLWPKKSHLINR